MIRAFLIQILNFISVSKILLSPKIEYRSISFTISFGVGILLQLFFSFELGIAFILLFLIILSALFYIFRYNLILPFSFLFIFFGILRVNIFEKNTYSIKNNYQDIVMEGRVSNIILKPRVNYIILNVDNKFLNGEEGEKNNNKTLNIRFKIKKNQINDINIGNFLKFTGEIYKIPEENFKFNSSPEFFAKYNNISGYGKIKQILEVKHNSNFLDKIKNFRIQKIQYITDSFKDRGRGIPTAILFGNTNFIPHQSLDNIRHIGIAHILAISGLHITIIMIFSFALFKRVIAFFPYFAVRYDGTKIASFCSIIFCYFYLFISGVSISAFRSFLMIFLSLISSILNQRPSSLYFLNISCFLILLNNPLSIKHPSFQLSFIAVLSLIGGYKYFFNSDLLYDTRGSLYKKFISISISEILTIFATTFFEIYHFGQFVFLGFISNFIIIPFVEFIILPLGFLSFLPIIGDFFMHLCIFFSNFIYEFSNKFSQIPFCYILTNQINKFELCIATAGLLLIFLVKNEVKKLGFIFFSIAVILYITRIKLSEKDYLFIISKDKKNILMKYENEYFYIKGERFDLKNFAQKFGQKEIKPISYISNLFVDFDEFESLIDNDKIKKNSAIIRDDFSISYSK